MNRHKSEYLYATKLCRCSKSLENLRNPKISLLKFICIKEKTGISLRLTHNRIRLLSSILRG